MRSVTPFFAITSLIVIVAATLTGVGRPVIGRVMSSFTTNVIDATSSAHPASGANATVTADPCSTT